MAKPEVEIEIHVDTSEIEVAIEKTNRLLELLREAQNTADSILGEDQKPN